MVDEAVAEVVDEEIVEELDKVDASLETDDEEPEITDSEEMAEQSDKAAKDEPEPEESSPSKKEDGFGKRIKEVTTNFYNEKQRADEAERRLAEIEKQQPTLDPGKTLADFEYDETQFAAYLTELATANAKTEVEARLQQERGIKSRVEFEAREAEFADTVDDYQLVTRNQNLQISETMIQTLQNADKGAETLYYLGKHPEVAAELASMHPLDAAREMGRIEATKLVKPKPSISTTPKPPPKIAAASESDTRIRSDHPDSDKLSDAEWLRRENKRLEKKYGNKY